jgi:hypothetical protein
MIRKINAKRKKEQVKYQIEYIKSNISNRIYEIEYVNLMTSSSIFFLVSIVSFCLNTQHQLYHYSYTPRKRPLEFVNNSPTKTSDHHG